MAPMQDRVGVAGRHLQPLPGVAVRVELRQQRGGGRDIGRALRGRLVLVGGAARARPQVRRAGVRAQPGHARAAAALLGLGLAGLQPERALDSPSAPN